VPIVGGRTLAKPPDAATKAHHHFLKTLELDEHGRPA